MTTATDVQKDEAGTLTFWCPFCENGSREKECLPYSVVRLCEPHNRAYHFVFSFFMKTGEFAE
jgi:hypothetical protein